MADRIELRGIRALGTIGVLPEEQERAQPFEIDMVLHYDVSRAGASDDLDETINYAVPIELATRVVETESHALLERVSTRIAEEVLAATSVLTVEVTIRKLRPPVPQDIASSGVTIRRSRTMVPPALQASRTRAFVALGSNLGDRRGHLTRALAGLPDVTAVSGLYETDPVGGPDQGAFLNMVVELRTAHDPYELLRWCLLLEQDAGRVRTERWGPRTLDADVLLYGDTAIQSELLTIPHPRMFERRFVLEPLADLAPELLPNDWDDRLPKIGIARVADLDTV